MYRADTELEKLKAIVADYQPDLLLLSPGPGNPQTSGVSMPALDAFKGQLPIFGVCLGMQVIVEYFGGKVGHAPEPMHGKPSRVTHQGQGVFAGLENPLQAGRLPQPGGDRVAGLSGSHGRFRGDRDGRAAQDNAHPRGAVPSRKHPDPGGRTNH